MITYSDSSRKDGKEVNYFIPGIFLYDFKMESTEITRNLNYIFGQERNVQLDVGFRNFEQEMKVLKMKKVVGRNLPLITTNRRR